MIKNKNRGFTLIETLAALVVIVLIVIGIGVGMDAATRSYKDSTYQSNSGTLSDILLTSVSDILRYSESVELGSGSDTNGYEFTFANKDYGVMNCSLVICDYNDDGELKPSSDGTGYLALQTVEKGEKVYSLLVNEGAYADSLVLTDFTAKAYKAVDDTGFYFDIAYTINDITNDEHTTKYSFRVRQINADIPQQDSGQESSEEDPIVDADTILIVYDQNTGDNTRLFPSVHGRNPTNKVYHTLNPRTGTTFTTESSINRAWYTFCGWSTSDGEFVYDAEQKVKLEEEEINDILNNKEGKLTLYAKWELKEYTVKYDYNNATSTKESNIEYDSKDDAYTFNLNKQQITLSLGNKYSKNGPEVIFKSNVVSPNTGSGDSKDTSKYTFKYWTYKEKQITGTTVKAGDLEDFDPLNDDGIVFTAKWSDRPSIKLAAATEMKTSGGKPWTFIGWALGDEDLFAADTTVSVDGNKSDIKYWAQYTIDVSFSNLYGGDPIPNQQTHRYGNKNDLAYPTTAPEKTGYTFNGWFTSDTWVTKLTENDDMEAWADNGIVTYYPHWTANRYTINYVANEKTGTATTPSTDATFGQKVHLAKNLFEREYTMRYYYKVAGKSEPTEVTDLDDRYTTATWEFYRWIDKDGKEYYQDTDYNVNFITDNEPSATLYVKWNSNTGKVTYPQHNGNSEWQSQWLLEGWADSATAKTPKMNGSSVKTGQQLTADSNVYAVLSRTITLNGNGGKFSDGNTTSEKKYYRFESTPAISSLSTPSLTGYTFAGWYTAATGGDKVTSLSNATYSSNGSLTLYAHWTIKSYTITYVETKTTPSITVRNPSYTPYGNDSANHFSTYYVKGNYSDDTVRDSSNNIIGTWTFDGWYKNGSKVTSFTVDGAAELTGTWTFTPATYDVTFNSKGGSTVSSQEDIQYGSYATEPSAPTKTGYDFNYWCSDSDCNNRYVFTTHITGDITLYAKWTPTEYTITYNLNGGSISSSNPTTYTIETPPFSLNSPTRDYYNFAGWYNGSNKVTSIEMGTYGDITLEAHWTAILYTITYNLNGGSISSGSNPSTYTVETATFSLKSPTRDGYNFNGWYNGSNRVTSIEKGSHGNIILDADWTKKTTCLVEGTKIQLADGTSKNVEDITADDLVMVYNHEKGCLDSANVIFMAHKGEEAKNLDVMNLTFDDGTNLKLYYMHGLFDLTLNKYVMISMENYRDYIGHEFYCLDDTLNGGSAKLLSVDVTEEYLRIFTPITKYHLNCFAEGFLNMPEFTEGLYNVFDYDKGTLQYNQEQMKKDIEKYGLYKPSDLSFFIEEELFNQFQCQYLKIAVAKGLTTLADRYYYTAIMCNSSTAMSNDVYTISDGEAFSLTWLDWLKIDILKVADWVAPIWKH